LLSVDYLNALALNLCHQVEKFPENNPSSS